VGEEEACTQALEGKNKGWFASDVGLAPSEKQSKPLVF
jgi:hypothetical protein